MPKVKSRRNSSFSLLRWIGIGFIILAVFLLIVQLVKFSHIRAGFQPGLKIADVDVGELTFEESSNRLLNIYMAPIEMYYGDSLIQVRPANLGFEIKLDSMLASADKQRTTESFWLGFWNYLWDRQKSIQNIPLQANIDNERILRFLQDDIAPRYDLPATPPMPIPGETIFNLGVPGTELDIEKSALLIAQALGSSDKRTITLALKRTSSNRPPIDLLTIMMKDIIDASIYDGIVEIYLQDLNNNQGLNFVYGKDLKEQLPENISFSAWSTIKIPVLVTAFRLLEEPISDDNLKLIADMVDLSDNDSTDALATKVIDPNLAPLVVTEDMQKLGLIDTFWAGFFSPGSVLLQRFETPANQRTDINTGPDVYNQTTPKDMGLLLQDIYYCSEYGGGSLMAAFPGEITQSECNLMVEFLGNNKIGVLLQAGVPAGTTVAHKHGWAYEVDDGYIHTIGDVGIIFSPGGDFILSIFTYHPVQAIFDPVNVLFANLANAAYNYFNLKSQ